MSGHEMIDRRILRQTDPARALLLSLLLLSVILNLCGYIFGWFYSVGPYDEVVHLITTFSGVAVLGRYAIALGASVDELPRSVVGLAAIGTGLMLGLAWEIVELTAGMIGDQLDTLVDLLMDAAGAGAAGLVVTSRRLFSRDMTGPSPTAPSRDTIAAGAPTPAPRLRDA